jgi:CRP-like cAMP-binding protein
VARTGTWQKAFQVAELRHFFQPDSGPSAHTPVRPVEPVVFQPRVLRRIKILAGMSDEQLAHFSRFVEVLKVPRGAVLARQGERGDSMFLLLEGVLQMRTTRAGRETILATLGPDDFFGDAALFDPGPRPADVAAGADSLVVRISTAAFTRLTGEAPDLATPFLLAIGKTLTARIRASPAPFQKTGPLLSAR